MYYRYHIKNGPALGKGLKIIRYKDFTIKRNQSRKRKENKRKETKKEVEDVQRKEKREEKEERWQNEKDEKEGWVWEGDKETGDWVWKDELANQFNATMNISAKRRRIDDVL